MHPIITGFGENDRLLVVIPLFEVIPKDKIKDPLLLNIRLSTPHEGGAEEKSLLLLCPDWMHYYHL